MSTVRQARKDPDEDLPLQRQAVARFIAERAGWTLTHEFTEKGISAFHNSSADRDVLQDALAAAARGEFDRLVVFKHDRLSRIMAEYPYVLSLFNSRGVRVWSVADDPGGRELKSDSLMEGMIRVMEGFIAQSESHNTSIRVTERMRQLAAGGPWWSGGRTPFGYRYDPSGEPVKLAVQPDESQVIHLMFTWYLDEGMGGTSLVARLNREGYRTRYGKLWHLTSLYRIMSNPVLTGRLAYGRTSQKRGATFVKGLHDLSDVILSEPVPELEIIPKERWETAMARMASYNKSTAEQTRHDRGNSSALLFTGLARCGACGAPLHKHLHMTRRQTRMGVKEYRYVVYKCSQADRRGAMLCAGQHSFSQKAVEEALLSAIREEFVKMDEEGVVQNALLYAEQSLWQQTTRRKHVQNRLLEAQRVHEAWLARLETFFENPSASLYSESTLAAQVRKAEERLRHAEAEATALAATTQNISVLKADLERWLRQTGLWWQRLMAADVPAKKQMLRQVIERIEMGREGFEITFRIQPSLIGATTAPLVWRKASGWGQ